MSTRMPYFKFDIENVFTGSGYIDLARHKQRRKKPCPGDLFAIEVVGFGWLAGRVIVSDPAQMPGIESGPFLDSYLIYIYKGLYDSCPDFLEPPIVPTLALPPVIIDRGLWTKGYAKPLGHYPLHGSEVLGQHCFYCDSASLVHDERGVVLEKVSRPCGVSGLFLVQGLRSWLHRVLHDGFDQDNHPLS